MTQSLGAGGGALIALKYLLSIILLFLQGGSVPLLNIFQMHIGLFGKVILGLALSFLRTSICIELIIYTHMSSLMVIIFEI